MAQRDSVVIRFEGHAGDGIISMGRMMARAAARAGYHVYTYTSFLAQVRGGQSMFQLHMGNRYLLSPGDVPDVVVALNLEAAKNQCANVVEDGLFVAPPFGDPPCARMSPGVRPVAIDFDEVATSETGATRGKNVVALGAVSRLLGLDAAPAHEVIKKDFASKGADVVDSNLRAFDAGWDAVQSDADDPSTLRLAPTTESPKLLLSGNEAVALGSIVAGVRFYAGYPITPASEVMEALAKHLPEVGGRMVQAEDEISALGMCIGAAFGGSKTMTATSGPGLSLMSELIGLAGMAELPIVIVDVQRAGPSTGMPTKDAQGDLNLAVFGTHGEVPRVVLAPQSVADCFDRTIEAVNVAHRFHVPVLVLSSQSLSHSLQTVELPNLDDIEIYEEPLYAGDDDTPYLRFRDTEDGGPSVRSVPGTPGGMYRTGGLEHDESGYPSTNPEMRNRMVERRRQRMLAVERAYQESVQEDSCVTGSHSLGVMSWGRTASTTREVVLAMREQGWDIGYLFPHVLWPMPDSEMERFLSSGINTLFVTETNATRQFAELIRARYTKCLVEHEIEVISITKDDGSPFSSQDIRERLLGHLSETMMRQQGLPFSAEEIKDKMFGTAVEAEE